MVGVVTAPSARSSGVSTHVEWVHNVAYVGTSAVGIGGRMEDLTPNEQATALDLMVKTVVPHLVDTDLHRRTLEAVRAGFLTYNVHEMTLHITTLGKADPWVREKWILNGGEV